MSSETAISELFTKKTGGSHNLSQLGYYELGTVTITIRYSNKYSGDSMGKTALRTGLTSENVNSNGLAATGNAAVGRESQRL